MHDETERGEPERRARGERDRGPPFRPRHARRDHHACKENCRSERGPRGVDGAEEADRRPRMPCIEGHLDVAPERLERGLRARGCSDRRDA